MGRPSVTRCSLSLTIGRAINFVRRGRDGTWRFAIAVMDPEQVQSTEAPR